MTADINVILQLLQRQIAPVPPAYSTVSARSIPAEPSGQYGTGTPVLRSMYTISPLQMDSRVPTQVERRFKESRCDSDGFCTHLRMCFLYSRVLLTLMLESLRSLRSPSPAVPMWPAHRLMPHSPLCLLKLRTLRGACRSRWSDPPPRTQSCAVCPTAPHCRRTWTSARDRLGCRNTSQTLFCPPSQDNREKAPAQPRGADTWGHMTSSGVTYPV